MTASSLATLFLDRVAATPQAQAFSYPRGETFVPVTWRERLRLSCNKPFSQWN